jgi:hypothetical protein
VTTRTTPAILGSDPCSVEGTEELVQAPAEKLIARSVFEVISAEEFAGLYAADIRSFVGPAMVSAQRASFARP